jgi:hypothetical protein
VRSMVELRSTKISHLIDDVDRVKVLVRPGVQFYKTVSSEVHR